jgi:O-antigen/teichoic acid export membrane protein
MIEFRSFVKIFSGEVLFKVFNLGTIFVLSLMPDPSLLITFALVNSLIVLIFDTTNNYFLHKCVNLKEPLNIYLSFLILLGILFGVSFGLLEGWSLEILSLMSMALTFSVFNFLRTDFQLAGDFGSMAKLSVVRSIPPFILATVVYFSGSSDKVYFFAGITAFNIAILFAYLPNAQRIFTTDMGNLFSQSGLNFPIMGYLVALSIFGQLDFIVLSRIFDDAELALIVMVLRLISIPIIFITAANSVIFPFIEKDSKSEESKKMITFTIILSLLVSGLGIFILPLLINGASIITGVYFGIIVLVTILGTLNIERTNRLLSNGFHKTMVLFFISSIIVKVLIIYLGYIMELSAIIILTVSMPVGLIIYNFLIWKLHETKYSFN